MNRSEYIEALSNALVGFDDASKRDILLEIEDHLEEMAAQKPELSEEELVAGLEKPKDLARALNSEGGMQADAAENRDDERNQKDENGRRHARITIDGEDLEETLRKAFDIARLFKSRRADRDDGSDPDAATRDNYSRSWAHSAVDRVRIQTRSADIRVLLSVDGFSLRADDCEGVPIRVVDDENGSIEVKTGSSREDLDFLELRVPSTVSSLVVSTASGDVSVLDRIGDLSISTASGDVDVRACAGDLKISTASGDIRIAASTDAIRAETASGSVDIAIDEQTSQVAAASVSGDVSILYPDDFDGDFSWSTLSGEVECDAPKTGPRTAATGLGLVPVKVSTVSGDISIRS